MKQPTMTTNQVPLPRAWLGKELPVLLGTRQVGELLEFWGLTRNGMLLARKLWQAGTLVNVTPKMKEARFETVRVIALWGEMVER